SAKAASRSLAARMVGMPCASRLMLMSAEIPAVTSRPFSSGSDERSHSSAAATRRGRRSSRRARSLSISGSASLPPASSTQIEDDRFLLREMLEHGFERGLLAQARRLHAAIGHVGLHDEVLIDLDEARFEALCRIERGLEVARPDRRRKAVVAVIRLADRVLVILEADDAGHRPEDLLAAETVVVGDAGEDNGLHEIALRELLIRRHGRAAQGLGARRLLADLDVVAHLLELLLRDDRADIGRLVQGVAHLHGVDLGLELRNEAVMDRLMDEDAARRRAALALPGEAHADDGAVD